MTTFQEDNLETDVNKNETFIILINKNKTTQILKLKNHKIK